MAHWTYDIALMQFLLDHRTVLLTKMFLFASFWGETNAYILVVTLIYVMFDKTLAVSNTTSRRREHKTHREPLRFQQPQPPVELRVKLRMKLQMKQQVYLLVSSYRLRHCRSLSQALRR